VEEVRGATEGESIVSGLFPEEVERLAVGEDVEQAQKLSVLILDDLRGFGRGLGWSLLETREAKRK